MRDGRVRVSRGDSRGDGSSMRDKGMRDKGMRDSGARDGGARDSSMRDSRMRPAVVRNMICRLGYALRASTVMVSPSVKLASDRECAPAFRTSTRNCPRTSLCSLTPPDFGFCLLVSVMLFVSMRFCEYVRQCV